MSGERLSRASQARHLLHPCPGAQARARRLVAGFVGEAAGEPLLFALQLVVSELVGNAVLYGSRSGPVQLELSAHRDYVEVVVGNSGERIHVRALRSGSERGGRGLEIVDALASRWSISSSPGETVVSVRVSLDDPSPAGLTAVGAGYETAMPRARS